MAIHTFICLTCGVKTEKLVRKTDPPPSCSGCGVPMVQTWSTPAPAQWSCSKGSL